MATMGAVCNLKKNKMCLTNVDETVFYDLVEKNKSEEFISCIELSDDPAPTTDSSRETAKTSSAWINTQPSASVDTLRISEHSKTEKLKCGGKAWKKKKKKNVDTNFLSLIPSQCHEGSLEYRVR